MAKKEEPAQPAPAQKPSLLNRAIMKATGANKIREGFAPTPASSDPKATRAGGEKGCYKDHCK